MGKFHKGQQVMCGRFVGRIVKVCDGQLTGMYEVRGISERRGY